jgi:hypothetical protein
MACKFKTRDAQLANAVVVGRWPLAVGMHMCACALLVILLF